MNGHGWLHLTPVNVAKIRDYSHLYRVVGHGAWLWGAGELGRSVRYHPHNGRAYNLLHIRTKLIKRMKTGLNTYACPAISRSNPHLVHRP